MHTSLFISLFLVGASENAPDSSASKVGPAHILSDSWQFRFDFGYGPSLVGGDVTPATSWTAAFALPLWEGGSVAATAVWLSFGGSGSGAVIVAGGAGLGHDLILGETWIVRFGANARLGREFVGGSTLFIPGLELSAHDVFAFGDGALAGGLVVRADHVGAFSSDATANVLTVAIQGSM